MRLLLAGVRPEEILCLTYTKAAAAEMRRRVSARLAEWATLPPRELVASLTEIEGEPPSSAAQMRARTLFAHALETPGGLKINTIHAFCEAVLHRFPLEAGVPFDFTVIEEVESAALIHAARESVIAEGLRGASEIAGAVETLFRLVSDYSLATAIEAALAEGRKLRRLLLRPEGVKARLRALVNHPEGAESSNELRRRVISESAFAADEWWSLSVELGGTPDGSQFADLLARCNRLGASPEQVLAAFLTGPPFAPRRRLLTKAQCQVHPGLKERLEEEQARIARLGERIMAAELIERSEALLDLMAAIVRRYEEQKRARSWLDFDDLVARLGDLLAKQSSAWVRYKLDAGITHILVDESQDTNPEQWRVIETLTAEFFDGESAVERPRTVFGVGDEKQSIYSFQGADPRLFVATGQRFAAKAAAVSKPFAHVPLKTSFRTLPGILQAVDRVFDDQRRREAVLADREAVEHATARAEEGGTVTLWPPVAPMTDDFDPETWPTGPVAALQSAPRRLAERIAREIRGWIDNRRPLGSRGRAVRAEDILILVQSRSALFTELIRALSQAGIPTPGADRLPVTAHIAVLDLLALGDVLTNPADDLQLAALLRSPLFDITEDDLFAIAADRPERQRLWQALEASPLPAAREAFGRLSRWRVGLDLDRPFDFFAQVLYRDGGLRRFHGRLGGEVDDVLSEFMELALAHEQSASPSLQGFLAEMRAEDISIRRDLAEPGNGVRVMTVHGAKGLEAPIVILADAASKAGANQPVPVIVVEEEPGPVFIYAPNKEAHTPQTSILRAQIDAAADREYWRKLYVGMTRAEDELYITGYLTQRLPPESWYEAVRKALEPEAVRVESPDGDLEALVFPALPAEATALARTAEVESSEGPIELPPLPPPEIVPVVRPSSAAAAPFVPERVFETPAESLLTADESRRAGIALHALLQHLDRVAVNEMEVVAEKAAATLLPDFAPEQRTGIARRALSIRRRPEFSALFGPASRAEVPFRLPARQHGRPVHLAGRIDRIVVETGRVLVVDYKSDALPPGNVSEVPASYLTQVGLYAYVASQLFPELVVEAGILWTTLESLMILPQDRLREAASAFTMR
jgi:ATP-dependent helicase/nuclease subunit A